MLNLVKRAKRKLKKCADKLVPQTALLMLPRLSRRGRIAKYLARHTVRKVHLGAGLNILPGWLNTDGIAATSFSATWQSCRENVYLDVSRRFPLDNESIDYIYSEHLIEHLSYAEGQFMLRECWRVLKRGGRIRIATPDFDTFVRLAGNELSAEQQHFVNEYVRFNTSVWSSDLANVTANQAIFVINHAFHAWGHQFIYNVSALTSAMGDAGFVELARQQPQQSSDSNFSGLEFRREFVGIFDALIVEGRKV